MMETHRTIFRPNIHGTKDADGRPNGIWIKQKARF